ncbi:polyhydroxyalkanoate synthase subunit PhaC [Candidatus Magnetomoraceae bacterium gMMP-15]
MKDFKTASYSNIDHFLHAWQGRFTASLSPAALMLAYYDWALHLANAPGKQMDLIDDFMGKSKRFWTYAMRAASSTVGEECNVCVEPAPDDRRFKSEDWQEWPYNLIHQSFLLTQKWWQNATTDVSGVSWHHQTVVSFVARQMLDVFAPSNFLLTNPEVLKVTMKQGGDNLRRGMLNFIEDKQRAFEGENPIGSNNFKVGEKVAITPGKVVLCNPLIELIQYAPATKNVYAEPILIVPAWIMKYYILDLSPHNSLVKYLVDKGHTVFMISWKNPTKDEHNIGMNNYSHTGIMAALNVISKIIPDTKIHTMGYCLGGTLLTIAVAAMSRDGNNSLKSMTLLAAQTDFREAGEMMLFIDESQVSFLEDIMWNQGYLDTKQMSGAFQLLRSNDLVWSQSVRDYLLGERRPMNDLMAWNADTTRMPFRMHSKYLRDLFLHNNLFQGRFHFKVDNRPIVISDIHIPVFIVGTQRDHVAPWRSVYKFNLSSDAKEITFVLTSGGHNAGIVSEPGHPRRTYQISNRKEGDKYIDPKTWEKITPVQKGSWWVPWQEWLAKHSTGEVPAPSLGAPEKGIPPLYDAPGTYVFQE